MSISGKYFDLDIPSDIPNALIRDNGNEIVFDFDGTDDYRYTVTVKRVNGTLFKGQAVSQPGGEVAEITCRVYEDRNEGITVLVGSHWKYPSESKSYRWFVELESEV
jgi:hypothetical protein